MNHIARLENTQANAPSKIPKNIMSDRLLNPEFSSKGIYKDNKLVNKMTISEKIAAAEEAKKTPDKKKK